MKREGKRVVIVEDEDDLQMILAEIVSSLGFDVQCFSDGEEALQELRTHSPHYLITDWDLRKGSGLALIQDLRMRNHQTPVFLMTGWDVRERVSQVKSDSSVKVIQKPFEMNTLYQFLGQVS
jgi:DNA-binding response OmpR family regulator